MPHADTTIESMFRADDSKRSGALLTARLAATLSKPWVLPPEGQQPDEPLPRNFQSVGSRGSTNLVGRLLLALYPPNLPWFVFTPTPEFTASQAIDPQVAQDFQQQLFLYGRLLMSQIEQMTLDPEDDRGQFIGFRSHKRATIEQILITGDALERMDDDYRFTLFRRDQYVTARDSSGAILYHMTRERKDPLELPEDIRAKAQLDAETLEAEVSLRVQDMYTRVEYQPQDRTWVVTQEMNGNVINEFTDQVSRYFATAFELVGENYGRGFVEQNLGDLRTLDEYELRRIDLVALAAKMLFGVDSSSTIRDKDLQQEPGSLVRRCKVVGGVVQDIGPIQFGNVKDYQMVTAAVQDKRADLFKAFLTESETTRNAERVTTAEIRRNVFEIESALGGVYATVADEQQRPLIRRLVHQYNMSRNAVLPRVPGTNRPAQEVRILTGLTALAEESEADKLLSALQILQVLGPEALNRVDMGIAVGVALRQIGFHEPGLIKSDAQMQADQEQAAQQQLGLQAGAQAIESAGAIAENQATIAPRRPAA